MIAFLTFFALTLSSALLVPLDNRCFTDGIVSLTKQMDHGIAEICIKDDISLIKTTSTQVRNTSMHLNTVFRKMLIQNYEDCNPVETPSGPIMIFRPNDDMLLIPHTFACRIPCTISLDEEEANIILHSEKLNHYEVMGTTTANRWFQGTTSYSLEHTCEHIQVTCGSTSLSFHACFKYHMACIRLLNKSYMPAFMIQSVCQNKELILMGCLVLIIFGILYIMTLTYICYILIPIFYPFTYLYGIIYNKSCKKCYYCGLAYHPLTKCGTNCVCGCMFENSERMKKHRESGLCRGYKSLRTARILCKNRGSSFILAIILSFLLLSFIQPIEGLKLTYKGEVVELENAVAEFENIYSKLDYAMILPTVYMSLLATSLLIIAVILIFYEKIVEKICSRYAYVCNECDMVHPLKGLKFFGDFTNKCNMCMCGCNYNDAILDESEYMIPNTHKYTVHCTMPARYYAIRKLNTGINTTYTIILTILFISSIAYATDTCSQIINNNHISDPLQCSVWYRIPTSCSSSTMWEDFIKALKATKEDQDAAQKIQSTLEGMLLESEKARTPIGSFLLESGALKMHCNELAEAKTKTGKLNKLLARTIEKAHLEICATGKLIDLCKCMRNEASCPSSTTVTNAQTHYKAHIQIFKNDVAKVVNALIKTYPGILTRELTIAMKSTNFSKIKEIAGKMVDKFGQADAAIGCMKYLQLLLNESELEQASPILPTPKEVPAYVTERNEIFKSMTDSTQKIKECKNIKVYKCSYIIASRFTYAISCNGNDNVFYEHPGLDLASKYNDVSTKCVKDPFCDVEFTTIPVSRKDELQTLTCKQEDSPHFDFSRFKPMAKCLKVSSQTCTYREQNQTFIECKNGFFYVYSKLTQTPGDDIGVYCFEPGCKANTLPHHVDNLQGCILHQSTLESRDLKEIVYENIEQLKHSLQETIKTDLIEHKYKLTMNLPKIIPSFKALSIMGTETDSGIDSAYIETNIIAKTGMSTGITLKTKNGENLFDIVIFIKSAHYESIADNIYTTGPTVGINMQHDEQCTGTCPKDLKKEGWLSFSKEHTSTWGCEEFGCLAINEGCLYGHCQDIIKPETRVYKRGNEEIPRITLCISLPDNTFCHDIDSFNPIITDKLEIQFISNEAGRIPKLFGYRSNKVLTGLINDRGTFSKMCGSVQAFNGKVWGAGNAKFDYICHAARRKDVTISRCFDNFYEGCTNLNIESNMVFDDKENKIQLLNRVMGEMRVKIKLGDIRYKVFEKNPSMDLKATCVGCIDCIKGLDCELSIVTNSETVCPVYSNCQIYVNNIKIDPSKQLYGIKTKCTTSVIEFTVCTQKVEAQISIVDKKETIEVGNSDQTYFVKEKDMRCGTWLCKISEQGISSIFAPFITLFGSYGKIVFYTFLVILALALTIYLLFPMCVRFKDLLKHNEIEYAREMYGYKKLKNRT
ncbi:polyprotein [Orthobunyavirus guajaraense]|uniref:Envelopment polyprotein n=1 Tax=Orthobunyavirus guajaraense TaxID=3052395 RepID=A0A0R7FN02_9VIRU|nr:polyprotein [Orthobunyavirus guajaraense]AKO90174.1 polyprotein [Orthobunyavirus guajaraense]